MAKFPLVTDPVTLTAAALSAHGVTKRFGDVVACDDVTVAFLPGRVHTLLGENGAGKSTLAAMLCGLYQPDQGEIRRNGVPISLDTPRLGLESGIGMVHQHFRLVDRFTVAENVVLGDRRVGHTPRMRQVCEQVAAISDQYGLPIDPNARVADLTVGQRQRVEIVKVLYRGVDVLLLDEPTAVLTPQESESLLATVRHMVEDGKAVVFISHKLGEVMSVSDDITVLRHGAVVGSSEIAGQTSAELAREMVGRDVDLSPQRATSPAGDERLRVSGLSVASDGEPLLDGVTLSVRSGEIVGVAGVSGNGQRELVDVISGQAAPTGGTVVIGDTDVTAKGPLAARAAGLAYVPEDRLGVGLAPSLSIADNLLMTRPLRWLVDRRKARQKATALIEEYDVRGATPTTPAGRLSGGNAQKVLLARELSGRTEPPKVIVAASPTRGLDVGAIEAVRARLVEFRAKGAATLLVSEDLDEVLALADRVVVMYRGTITLECAGETADRAQVGLAMAGVAADAGSGAVSGAAATATASTTPSTPSEGTT